MIGLAAFRDLFARRAGRLSLALALSFVVLVSGVALLGTSGWFITATALTTAGLAFNLFVPSAMVRGLSFIRIAARYGERLIGHDATLRLLADLRSWLFGRLFPRLPLRDRGLRHGDLVSRLTADVDALDTAFLVAIGPILSALLIGTAMTALLAWLLPAAALVYGCCAALAALGIPAALVAAGRRPGKAMVERAAEARAAVLDGLDGHMDLVALGVVDHASQSFRTIGEHLAATRRRLAAYASTAAFGVGLLASIALASALWFGLAAFDRGAINGPVLAGLLLAVAGSFEASSTIVRSVGKLGGAMAAAERLSGIANAPIAVADPVHPLAMPADVTLRVQSLFFSHEEHSPVLEGLDLTILPGEHVAITGPSGGGKSTLLSLLLRLMDPQSGMVTLGGIPLPQLALADIHARIALLEQNSVLFHDTVRANLLLANDGADDAALWSALDAAGIGTVIRALPRGLDTLLGEGGRTLSVGQARRLCLARILLSRADILLLDEPSSGLDAEAETAFFETLKTAARGRSVIVVTHAAIPADTMDRVLSLRHGRLA